MKNLNDQAEITDAVQTNETSANADISNIPAKENVNDDTDCKDPDILRIYNDAIYLDILKKKKFSLFCMRTFDIVASFFGLLILLIPFVIISLIIICDSEGGVFFKQTRVGKNGKEFKIFKFRTMVKNADRKGLSISTSGDNRITKIGRILRKTKIDELPQLINVFVGQMSLVGPRPEVPKYVELYNSTQRNVLLVRPGITDIASIEFRNENDILEDVADTETAYVNEIMPIKLKYNLDYIKKMGLIFNIKLIFKTILAVI